MLIACTLPGCDQTVQPASRTVIRRTKQPLSVNAVEIQRVESTVEMVTYFGTLEPNRQAILGFPVGGNVKKMAAVGDRIFASEVIASLEVAELEQQQSTLQRNLESARSAQQTAQVESIQAELAQVNAAISASQITAPFDCAVDTVFAASGGLIESRKPVVKVVELAKPHVKIGLPRRVAQWIAPDDEYYFMIAKQRKPGKLLRRGVTETPAGLSTLWFVLDDLQGVNASFGASVECRFNLPKERSGFWVPLTALHRSGQGIWSVMLIERQDIDADPNLGEATKRLVEVKQFDDKRVLIDGSFTPGDLIIADGGHRVVAGQPVVINSINPESAVARKPGSDQ